MANYVERLAYLLNLDELPLNNTSESIGIPIAKPDIDLQQYYYMIVGLAAEYWRKLPASAQAWISLDDAIQDGLICAWRASLRWNPSRGRPSTLIHTSVSNMFINRLFEQFTKKRLAYPVPMDEAGEDHMEEFSEDAEFDMRQAAKEGVERILQEASCETRAFLAGTLFGVGHVPSNYSKPVLSRVASELKSLMAEYRVSVRDIAAVVAMK
jgi:DNA-directed RNA polymerase specialized sigma24 family protein